MNWEEYWNSEKNINSLVLSKWSDYYCDNIEKVVTFSDKVTVLDFGSGDGKIAKFIATKAGKVIAYDNSDFMYNLCVKNTIISKNIFCQKKINDSTRASIVVMHSTLQYIEFNEFKKIIKHLSTIVKANTLVISDIIPKEHNIFYEAICNLLYARKNSFFVIYALFLFNELKKRFFSDNLLYLNKYNKDSLIKVMKEYGWKVMEVDNLSPSKNRYTIICYK
jgi:2-polyprenyl-3-methyl-5-hydroxy-6-metoxy-1,4-benzoquinol methylase